MDNSLEELKADRANIKRQITQQTNVDKACLYYFSKGLVRIEYPGLVKNVSKAIETLGGLYSIEMAIADHRNKLELSFHPDNKYNKPCVADRDDNCGILLCIRENQMSKISYEVVGIVTTNFKFNKLCDFQYLPLVPIDSLENNVEYVYDKIFPEELPSVEWLQSRKISEQPRFFIPPCFSRCDIPQKLHSVNKSNLGASFQEVLKLNEPKTDVKSKMSTKAFAKFVNLQSKNAEIPDGPVSSVMEAIKYKNMEEKYQIVKKLFEERPIWKRVGVIYKTGISEEHIKWILPAVAYFCNVGPWRVSWIRFSYNPIKDFNSRIYQTLDYRIRTSEGTNIKVDAKRSYNKKLIFACPEEGKSVEERNYILSPNQLPPARQMFYQFCDILIPEIQEMVQRLPKLKPSAKYDSKNGWLPEKFIEQCREIVNKYVLERVKTELLEDSIKMQNLQITHDRKEKSQKNTATYCSKMLNNIKRGIYSSVSILPSTSKSIDQVGAGDIIDTVNLTTEGNMEEVNMDDVVNSIPEYIQENSDEEDVSIDFDIDIDMEAVAEINKLIKGD